VTPDESPAPGCEACDRSSVYWVGRGSEKDRTTPLSAHHDLAAHQSDVLQEADELLERWGKWYVSDRPYAPTLLNDTRAFLASQSQSSAGTGAGGETGRGGGTGERLPDQSPPNTAPKAEDAVSSGPAGPYVPELHGRVVMIPAGGPDEPRCLHKRVGLTFPRVCLDCGASLGGP
jgi:hypothetical protein